MKRMFIPVVIFVFTVVTPASFAIVVFDLRDLSAVDPNGLTIEDLDETQTFQLIRGRITATLTAGVAGLPGGQLNQTGSGFGVNAPGGLDDTDQIDGDEGLESISVNFDSDVWLLAVQVSEFGSDQASLRIGTHNPIPLDSNGFQDQDGVFIAQGESFQLSHISGNGLSFDAFEAARVPEPGTFVLFSVLALVWPIRQQVITKI